MNDESFIKEYFTISFYNNNFPLLNKSPEVGHAHTNDTNVLEMKVHITFAVQFTTMNIFLYVKVSLTVAVKLTLTVKCPRPTELLLSVCLIIMHRQHFSILCGRVLKMELG